VSIGGPVPEWLLSGMAAATLFTVMFDIGLAIAPAEFRVLGRQPTLLPKAIFAVVVAVPAIAWVVARAFDLPRNVEIGVMLMAIAPGAPVALRRSLDAGGHRYFAPALQISVAVLSVASMPFFISALNEYYAGQATIDPRHLARQVFVAQLLPLGLGMATKHFAGASGIWLEPKLRRLGKILLVLLVILALIEVWQTVVNAGFRVGLAIVAVIAGTALFSVATTSARPALRIALEMAVAVRVAGSGPPSP